MIIILLFFATTGFAQSESITIDLKDAKIETVLKEIEKQSGYRFFYDASLIKMNETTDVFWNAIRITVALDELFGKRGIAYRFVDKQIVLYPAKQSTTDFQTQQHVKLLRPPSGTIHGVVTDAESGQPISYAYVVIPNTTPQIGILTDSVGYFRLNNIPVGRQDIQSGFVGYTPALFKDVMVSSGKEVFLGIALREIIQELNEVIVRPKINKESPLNPMAVAGARMFSVEEASRYAGGFDDPARLVTAFAGVAGIINNNGVAIRGNSPQFLQWRIEGVETVNPTHFSDMTGVGGGILTAFSTQTLNNSDFFTGGYPAEYGNSLSGVFDMQLRNGNNRRREHTAQIGTLGTEFSSEGPFGKVKTLRATPLPSYLFSYRYSSMDFTKYLIAGLIPDMTSLSYQDLSFKVNVPTKQAGTFSVWGIGLINQYHRQANKNQEEWSNIFDRESNYKQTKAIGGVGHKIFIDEKSFFKSDLAVNFIDNKLDLRNIGEDGSVIPVSDMKNTNWNISLNTYLNTKFSSSHTNRTGFGITGLFYNLDYLMSPDMMLFPPDDMVNYVNSEGNSMAVSAFSQSSFRLNNYFTMNVGLHGDYFRLTNKAVVEPRIGFKWQILERLAFGLAYGKHSRRENIDYYFVQSNKHLDFAKAHHFVLAYDWSVSEYIRLKVETYFQYLYNIPVEKDSPFSLINHRNFWMMLPLVNDGKGKNYGIEFTLEHYLHKGYYYLFTTSLFQSSYKGGDGVWRNTRQNRNFIINALGGKEWEMGRAGQNMLYTSLRITLQGCERYIPVDETVSIANQKIVYDYSRAYHTRLSPEFISHFTIGYKINHNRLSHEFAVKVINLTGYKEFDGNYHYNYRTNRPEKSITAMAIPNVSYKIEF